MPIKYKIDILAALKDAGYTSYKIRKNKLFSQEGLQKLRTGELVSWDKLTTLCSLLHCQPGDLVEYVDD